MSQIEASHVLAIWILTEQDEASHFTQAVHVILTEQNDVEGWGARLVLGDLRALHDQRLVLGRAGRRIRPVLDRKAVGSGDSTGVHEVLLVTSIGLSPLDGGVIE